MERIDLFKFQDQDFSNLRRNFQAQLAEKLRTQVLESREKQLEALGSYQRPKRAAALESLKALRGNDGDEHSSFRQARKEEAKQRKQYGME